MSLNLIFIIAIVIGVIGIGIVIMRKIPILASLSESEIIILKKRQSLWQKIKGLDYKQHWLNLLISLEKFLRRVKIWFLKVENILTRLIVFLRRRSQIATQRSKEWIRQKELKRRKVFGQYKSKKKTKTEQGVFVKIKKENQDQPKTKSSLKDADKKQTPSDFIAAKISEQDEQIEQDDDLSISELKKPIKEEQKWIDLIVENPKNITAYKYLGFLYWRQHNYKDAKSSLEMAVKLGSKDKKVQEIINRIKENNKQ